MLGYNAPEDAILPAEFRLEGHGKARSGAEASDRRLASLDDRFPRRPERRHGSRHRLARQDRPPLPAQRSQRPSWTSSKWPAIWLRDAAGNLTKRCRHICWDGCMFPNAVMHKPETWNEILAAMIAVRDAHGWKE